MSENKNNFTRAAEAVIAGVGGAENISAATHCATRLRLVLKDESKIDKNIIDNEPMIKGNFLTAGQFQLIIGTGLVNKVYAELIRLTGAKEVSTADAKSLGGAKGNIVQRFVKMLSDIFVPIIPAIVAGGLLMGINNVLTSKDLFFKGQSLIEHYPQWADLADVINLFANAPFVFLPILIAFSATKRFGGTPYLGAALGMIMVHPALTNNYALAAAIADGSLKHWHIFGIEIAQVGYQGTVLPILVCTWILATLEKNIRKVMPASIDLLLTPLLALFITAFLTFTFVGPITRDAGEAFTNGITWLYNTSGILGGAILGLIYAPIVITGMHNSFIPVETQLIANTPTTGGTFIFPIASMNNVAQGAAALAALFITKDQKLKGIASASGVSALLGITEPAMFGVNLKLRYPFYAALIGTAVSSAYITAFGTKAVALGAAGLIGFISISAQYVVQFFIGLAISIITTFVLTFVFAKTFGRKTEATANNAPIVEENASAPTNNTATPPANPIPSDWQHPINGNILDLSATPDAAFGSGAMGIGYAIDPISGDVCAPCAGTLDTVFPTKHAFGITADNGTAILIHIGMDTVQLKGEGFTALVGAGSRVSAGQPIMRVDWEKVKAQAPSIITPIVFPEVEGGKITIENGMPVYRA